MIHQADLFESANALKERGQQKVLDHSGMWKDRATDLLAELSRLRNTFTAEDLRDYAKGRLESPHHCNAWGAIMTSACKRGLIRKTGDYVASGVTSSHGRMIAVWRAA